MIQRYYKLTHCRRQTTTLNKFWKLTSAWKNVNSFCFRLVEIKSKHKCLCSFCNTYHPFVSHNIMSSGQFVTRCRLYVGVDCQSMVIVNKLVTKSRDIFLWLFVVKILDCWKPWLFPSEMVPNLEGTCIRKICHIFSANSKQLFLTLVCCCFGGLDDWHLKKHLTWKPHPS